MDYVTVYRKDYYPKRTERTLPATFHREYDDPITGPCKEYLPPIHKLHKLSASPHNEHPDTFTVKLLKKRPNLKAVVFAEPLDHQVVTDVINSEGVTKYQDDFCKYEDTIHKPVHVILPEDWPFPATAQSAAFRDPAFIRRFVDIHPRTICRPVEQLRPNEKLQKIFKVTTGISEYTGTVGKLGSEVLKYKYYGVKQPKKLPDIWEIRRQAAGLTDEDTKWF